MNRNHETAKTKGAEAWSDIELLGPGPAQNSLKAPAQFNVCISWFRDAHYFLLKKGKNPAAFRKQLSHTAVLIFTYFQSN